MIIKQSTYKFNVNNIKEETSEINDFTKFDVNSIDINEKNMSKIRLDKIDTSIEDPRYDTFDILNLTVKSNISSENGNESINNLLDQSVESDIFAGFANTSQSSAVFNKNETTAGFVNHENYNHQELSHVNVTLNSSIFDNNGTKLFKEH